MCKSESYAGKGVMFIAASVFGVYFAFSGSDSRFEKQDDSWPFTVESVVTGCDSLGYPYVDAGRAGTYGLTGYATSNGYPDVSAIHIKGKSLGPFIDSAISQCMERDN